LIWASAQSLTSIDGKWSCGTTGISPIVSFLIPSTELEQSLLRGGPMMKLGWRVIISVSYSSLRKSIHSYSCRHLLSI
jgi:hypothetical protein